MPKISAFIIAKNEQAVIERALKSLVSFCDEIILVDTGSTDQTKRIALNYTDKIFDFKWVDDFSAARNFALSKCTGDWIIYLDADDEIEPATQNLIKETIENAAEETLGFLVNYHYSADRDLLTPRIFRNNPGLKFIMPVHEYLDLSEEQKPLLMPRPELTVIHHKTAEQSQAALQRNVRILNHALKNDPQNFHLNFFLAREKYNLGKFEEVQKILSDIANNPPVTDTSFFYLVFLYLGLSYQKLNNGQMAVRAFREAQNYYNHLAEPVIYEADTWLYQMNNPEEAKQLYHRALSIPKPETTFPLNPSFYYDYPKDQLKKIERLKMPIALVCGYYGIPNVGDEMMLAAIIKKYPRHRIIVASYNPELTQKIHGVESVPHRHAYFDHTLKLAQLVIIGGGTLFHDQGLSENINISYYCGIINQAMMLFKDVVILGVGVDKISLEENQELIKENFPHCSEITVRDELSKTRLLKYGVNRPQIKVADDLAFQLRPSDYLEKSREELNIVVDQNPVSKPLIGINLCPPVVSGSADYQQRIEKELIPFIAANKDLCDFIFIPGAEKDLELHAFLKEQTGIYVPIFKPPENSAYLSAYFNIINSCQRIIAARFHLILLAHLLNKPVEALSYAEKTDGLIKKYNIGRFRNQSAN